MKTLWQKFWFIILGGVVTVALSGASAQYISKKTAKDIKIESSAPKTYVDAEVKKVLTHSNAEDFAIREMLKDKASQEKVDLIYQQTQKIYDMVYELNGRIK
jgi:hypothetical protein